MSGIDEFKKIILSISFIKRLKGSIRSIAFTTISISILSLLYSYTLTPVYVAELVMIPASQNTGGSSSAGGLDALARIAGFTTQSQGEEETALAILKTRDFLQTYVEEENLLPVLFPTKWDDEKNEWIGKQPDILSAVSKIKSSIFIFRKNKIITIMIEWDNPELASKLANDLIAKVNEYIRNETTKEAKSNIFFLEKQLVETNSINIKNVMYRLIEDQMSQIMIANSREQFAFKVIDSAIPPDSPSRPNHTLAILIGFLLGLSVSLISKFTKDIFLKQN
tara:strand:- start:1968 stop:2807 length:840 start_codon:yes stop_codon:yes gene_type:complete